MRSGDPAALGARVEGELARLDPGGALLLAVSGGADSMALVELLDTAPLRSRLIVAHYDHGTRSSSAGDAAHVTAEAARRGLELVTGRCPARLEGERRSEAALRDERYAFLAREAAGREATIVTAHTLDDHAETVLACLLRDAGVGGLAGIPAVGRWRTTTEGGAVADATVIRPALGVRRFELRQLLERRGLGWREDETNHDDSNLRARLRRLALPALEAACERDPVDGLVRLAELARLWSARLDEDLDRLLPAAADATLEELAALPEPALCHWLHRQGLRWSVHIRWAADRIRAGAPGRRSLPGGLVAEIAATGPALRFEPERPPLAERSSGPYR